MTTVDKEGFGSVLDLDTVRGWLRLGLGGSGGGGGEGSGPGPLQNTSLEGGGGGGGGDRTGAKVSFMAL